MTICNISPPSWPKIHDQQLLTLCWCSFSWWGRERLTFSVAYKGSQYFVYDYLLPITAQMAQDIWPRIVDALFTLIFMMWQGAVHFLLYPYRQRILHLWLFATYRPQDYPRFMTESRWHSVDSHFATGVSTICNHLIWSSQSFMLIWQHFSHFHLLSSWSLHCSVLLHTNISCKIYFTVSVNSG